tara:strand:- start:161 stop:1537 length:1377 start_codon:yes stop_codon:yes gene_type:complete
MSSLSYRANDIELDSVLLFNSKRNTVDLEKIMIEFNVFHDLFVKGIKCEIFVHDSNALIDTVPIVGDETIVMQFRTPTFEKKRRYVFRVYKITDRTAEEQRAETYTIHGISQEVLSNERKSVNKSYTDLKGSQIVSAVYDNFLRPTEEEYGIVKKNIELNIQDTLQNHSFVFPGEKPYDVIDFVGSETFPEIKTQESIAPNFIFYQREEGWNFKTIDSLIEADPVEDFFYAPANNEVKNDGKGEKIHDFQKISTIDMVSQLDTIDNLRNGLYSHKIKTIDPILKVFNQEFFIYSNDMTEIAHLEKEKKDFDSEFLISEDSFFNSSSDTSTSYYSISNIGENYSSITPISAAVKTDPQIRNPRRIHDRLKFDVASRFQLSNIVLSITIPGNTDIHIGDVINVHVPLSTENADFAKKLKLLWDKKFLITTLRHVYQKNDNVFFTVIECVKDTYAKKTIEV